MNNVLFTFKIPAESYRFFVRDWLNTHMSFWKNVTVRHKRFDRKQNLCEVRIIINDTLFLIEYFEHKVFGRNGILAREGWWATLCTESQTKNG